MQISSLFSSINPGCDTMQFKTASHTTGSSAMACNMLLYTYANKNIKYSMTQLSIRQFLKCIFNHISLLYVSARASHLHAKRF
jgi:hypothetical protein